jgi:hypothetical protein
MTFLLDQRGLGRLGPRNIGSTSERLQEGFEVKPSAALDDLVKQSLAARSIPSSTSTSTFRN